MPFFTIVIPSYNSADYLSETLKSLFEQEFKDFEVLIVDDGSTDASVEVAKEYMSIYNLHGQVIRRPDSVTKGVSSCRNLGIRSSSSEWVCFLDSDDLFLPEKLIGTKKLITQYGQSCLAYQHAARDFEDGTNKTIPKTQRQESIGPEDIMPWLTKANEVRTSTVTIKKELLLKLGCFDTTLHGIEDYMMWLRVSKQTKWYYSAQQWTDYRVRAQSLMGGREMQYYVLQNANLMKSLRNLNEFTESEISAVDKYLFVDVMNYYAIQAINRKGWPDFLKGLASLSANGKLGTASNLLAKHLKFKILKSAGNIFKSNKK